MHDPVQRQAIGIPSWSAQDVHDLLDIVGALPVTIIERLLAEDQLEAWERSGVLEIESIESIEPRAQTNEPSGAGLSTSQSSTRVRLAKRVAENSRAESFGTFRRRSLLRRLAATLAHVETGIQFPKDAERDLASLFLEVDDYFTVLSARGPAAGLNLALPRTDSTSTFHAAVWRLLSSVALRESGRYIDALQSLRDGLSVFSGDSFGIAAWAESELMVCEAMVGEARDENVRRQPFGLFEPLIDRNIAWIHAARGETDDAVARLESSMERAIRRGLRLPALFAIVDLARFGSPSQAVQALEQLGEPTTPRFSAMADAVRAFASCDVDAVLGAYRKVKALCIEPLASELAVHARSLACRRGIAECARMEAITEVFDARTPRLLSYRPVALTGREHLVCRLAIAGLSSKQIGERLRISVRTVDNLLGRAYQKCAVSGRVELCQLATSAGATRYS